MHSLLAPQRPTAIVDIGAGVYGEAPPYAKLLAGGFATLAGFEPQVELCAAANAKAAAGERYFPYVISDGRDQTFYQCRYPAMSGLKKPNPWRLYQFTPLAQWGEVVATSTVQTRRLDDLVEVAEMDLLKIDVEGSELDVFRNGRKKLERAVVVFTEASFVPIYDDQALFGDIDVELRSLGFMPHYIAGQFCRMIAPMMPIGTGGATGIRQIHAVDVVYVRDFAKADELSGEQLKHMALIAHHCLDSYDLAFRCIFELAKRGATAEGNKDHYLELMKQRISELEWPV